MIIHLHRLFERHSEAHISLTGTSCLREGLLGSCGWDEMAYVWPASGDPMAGGPMGMGPGPGGGPPPPR